MHSRGHIFFVAVHPGDRGTIYGRVAFGTAISKHAAIRLIWPGEEGALCTTYVSRILIFLFFTDGSSFAKRNIRIRGTKVMQR